MTPSPEKVIETVAIEAGVTVADLTGPSRKRKLSYARFVCYDILRRVLRLTAAKVAELFKRDYTTIAVGTPKASIARTDPQYAEIFRKAERKLFPDQWVSRVPFRHTQHA